MFGSGDFPTRTVTTAEDTNDYELGMRFSAIEAGTITQLRYYRGSADAGDTDVRTLNLWTAGGVLLGSVTVTSAPGQAGWQIGTLATPIAIAANTAYIVSYGTLQNYAFSNNFFATGDTSPTGTLVAPVGAGTFSQTPGTVPTTTVNSNYWVDVAFTPTVNSPPVFTSPAGYTVAENQTVVGQVAATDPEAGILTYAIITGLDGALFQINAATGALQFISAQNYEAGKTSYALNVSVSDGTNTVNKALTVTLTDVDEFDVTVPVDTNATANSVAENATVGTVVGITASASDADATTNAVTYSLSNSANGRFAINATTGVVTVAQAGVFDFDLAPTHTITIRATSADGSFAEAAMSST